MIVTCTVPEQVVGLEWKPLNTTSVQIFWKVPKVANGIIIGYTLSYTNLATLPVTQWTSLTLNSTKHYAEVSDTMFHSWECYVYGGQTIYHLQQCSDNDYEKIAVSLQYKLSDGVKIMGLD